MVGYRYSVVIPTKDRPLQIHDAVERVLTQTRLPAQIIVVDASEQTWEPPAALNDQAARLDVALQVITDAPSTAGQRNSGVAAVRTPIVLLLDDDIDIDEHYASALLSRWDRYGLEHLGGVAGSRRRPPQSSRGRIARRLMQVHSANPRGEATRVRASGKLSWVDAPASDVMIPAVGAGAVSYRTQLLRKHRFDEHFGGYALGEDLDVSQRISAEAPILQTPDAWYSDMPGPGGGSSLERWHYRGRRETYFRMKHLRKGMIPKGAFAVSIVGETIAATYDSLRERNPVHVWNFLSGVAETLRERRTGQLKPRPYYAGAAKYHKRRIRGASGRLAPGWAGTRVLGYHRVADEAHPMGVTPQRFRQQIEAMLGAGLAAADLTSALEMPCTTDGSNRFCVTFDDGYLDVLLNAVPILEDLGVPAMIYVSSWAVDGSVRFPWYDHQPPMMGWDELRDLVAHPLFELGAHGRTHAPLPYLAAHQAAQEIRGSRSDLEQQVAVPVHSFCYSAGLYDERDLALVREAGFTTAVTTDPGVITRHTRPHAIPRTMISTFDDTELFSAKINGILDTRTRLEEFLARRRVRMP